jgi:hypothetical protein
MAHVLMSRLHCKLAVNTPDLYDAVPADEVVPDVFAQFALGFYQDFVSHPSILPWSELQTDRRNFPSHLGLTLALPNATQRARTQTLQAIQANDSNANFFEASR